MLRLRWSCGPLLRHWLISSGEWRENPKRESETAKLTSRRQEELAQRTQARSLTMPWSAAVVTEVVTAAETEAVTARPRPR